MLQFPPFLEDLILTHLKRTYLGGKGAGKTFNEKDFKYFSKGAQRLSKAFTLERSDLPSNYLNDPVLCSGYLLYFLPVNFLKIVRVLRELKPGDLFNGRIRVLDVGAGPGTNMLGMMTFFADMIREKKLKDVHLDFTLLDQNYSILKTALTLHDAYREHLKKKHPGFDSTCTVKNYDLRRGPVHRFLGNYKYHFVVMSNVLNEFDERSAQLKLVSDLMNENLEVTRGKMILIEPATKKVSRDLQALRDELTVHSKKALVLSPCLHQQACPLNLANKRDWCHFYFTWQRPKFIEKIDRLIGNKKDFLACSYLLLARAPAEPQPEPASDPSVWRVISNVMPTRGKKELLLCGPRGRYHITRLDRSRSKANLAIDEAKRGNLVKLNVRSGRAAYDADGKFVMTEEDAVQILDRL